jgi:hypothetical protein
LNIFTAELTESTEKKLIISYHELTRIETDKECTAESAENAEKEFRQDEQDKNKIFSRGFTRISTDEEDLTAELQC